MPSVFPSPQEIIRAVITALVVGAVFAIGGALLGFLDALVPLWALAIALLLVPLAFVFGRVTEAGESLEPYYVFHVQEVLDTLQKVIAGEIPGVAVNDFIERGILAPARQWLTRSADEDIRISILVPSEGRFAMEMEAGHSVEARQRFDLEVHGSLRASLSLQASSNGPMTSTRTLAGEPMSEHGRVASTDRSSPYPSESVMNPSLS